MYPNQSNVSLPPNPKVPKGMERAYWYNSGEMREYIDAGPRFAKEGYGFLQPITEDDMRFHRQGYFAATTFVDVQIGKVMAALETYNFHTNTISLVWSDHGWHLGDTNSWGKCTNFETGTRNTLMWRIPNAPNPPSTGRLERTVEMVDLFPTLIDLAGLPPISACHGDQPPTTTCLQGTSYASLFGVGSTSQYNKSYAFSQWPYNNGKSGVIMGYTAKSDDGYRLTEYVHYADFVGDWTNILAREFYDYHNDPHETVNNVNETQYQQRISEMHSVMLCQFANKC
eukprot:m.247635 g.247635  ORF g.247635 m.247635 type:complete len:284 (-) comp16128_c0_seq15:1344-2195(-)